GDFPGVAARLYSAGKEGAMSRSAVRGQRAEVNKNGVPSFRYPELPPRHKTARKKGLWDFIRRFAARRGEFKVDELFEFMSPIQARQNCIQMLRRGHLKLVRKGVGGCSAR